MRKQFFRMIATMLLLFCCMGAAQATETLPNGTKKELTVLMYHHLAETSTNGMTVSTTRFAEHLDAIARAGYQTVTSADLIAFVEQGVALPDKAVWITFDDGYDSNLTIGAPILEQKRMVATIFAIGLTEGKTTYRNTGIAITPHFSYQEALPWAEKGVIEVMSHSYDFHHTIEHDGANSRIGAVPFVGERLSDFITAFRSDVSRSISDIKAVMGYDITAFAYPYGKHSGVTDAILRSLGIKITVTIREESNVLTVGQPTSLYAMNRYFALENMSGSDIVALLK